MQIRLMHIMIAVTVICVLFGLTFASPPILGIPLIGLLLVSLPASLVTGTIWSTGKTRAGFVGALISAAAPWLSVVVIFFPEFFYGGRFMRYGVWEPAMSSDWWLVNLLVLSPLVCATIGWVAARLTYRFVTATLNDASAAREIP
jgi:hypothetical protein